MLYCKASLARSWKYIGMSGLFGRVLSWLTAGYPDRVPGVERVPLLALLARRLTEEEVAAVADEFDDWDEVDDADIGVAVTEITDALPLPRDVERVRARLNIGHHHRPFDRDEEG